MKRLLLLVFMSTGLALAQTGGTSNAGVIFRYFELPFASLPTSAPVGTVYVVNDASAAGSCAAGGGTFRSICRWTGSAWESLGGIGSGGAAAFSSVTVGGGASACGSATGCIAFTGASTAGTPAAGQGYMRFDSITKKFLWSVDGATESTMPEHVISWDVTATGDAKTYLPVYFACTIYAVDVTADQSGTFASDIDRHNAAIPNTTTDKISGTDGPALSAAQANLSHTPASWGSAAIAPGDVLNLNVTTFTTVTHVHVQLRCH